MKSLKGRYILGAALLAVLIAPAHGQNQYIGYVYPAGGQQGTTFPIRLGGQALAYASGLTVTGEGVSVRLVDYYRVMNNQELALLRSQLRELQKKDSSVGDVMAAKMAWFEFPGRIGPAEPIKAAPAGKDAPEPSEKDVAKKNLIERLQRLFKEDQRNPAVRAHTELVFAEVTVEPDAKPGRREIRVITKRGVSNALPFYVGQVPEVAREPMTTAQKPVLGKEYMAQRKRPANEAEMTVNIPCAMNGQVGPGEINSYRFNARKGQKLVISAKARDLIPYVADGVPGWFQAVLRLHDASGKEIAYNDDFRFHPDPVLLVEIPADGEYVLAINEAIFRGRESFVYRIEIGELPYLTSIFPLGGRAGEPVKLEMEGWNLEQAKLAPPSKDAAPGRHMIAAANDKFVSNHVPFALDTLPEAFDKEPNNDVAKAQKVTLPVIINGRADQPGDWDVFEVNGKAGETIVMEVRARRLESPFDSFLKVTDASGKVLALNDDYFDAASGLNTDHADSYLMLKLPADGKYFVHLGETRRHGGKAYAYRLRISQPRPDFELRVVPSRFVLRSKSAVTATVYAIRRDGFTGPIKLAFKDLPKGIESAGATLPANQDVVKFAVKTTLTETEEPVDLTLIGSAKVGDKEIVNQAVPAEDQMQAFLWRHLMPAEKLPALVYNPSYQPPADRVRPPILDKDRPKNVTRNLRQSSVDGYMRQIEGLYQDWLFTDEFANKEIAGIEARLIR